jgi:hypothetical protein
VARERGRYGPLQEEHAAQIDEANNQIESRTSAEAEEQVSQRSSEAEQVPEPTRPEGRYEQSPGWAMEQDMVSQQTSANEWVKESWRRRQEAAQSSPESEDIETVRSGEKEMSNARLEMIEKAKGRFPEDEPAEKTSAQVEARDSVKSDEKQESESRQAMIEQANSRMPSENTHAEEQEETHTRGRGR